MSFTGTGKVWINGKIVDWSDASIHIASHVIHYGSAVFEGMRCYQTKQGSAFFRLEAHMRRLYDSARIYRMDYSFDREAFTRGVVETVQANGLEACYIRPVIVSRVPHAGCESAALPRRRDDPRLAMGRVPRIRMRSKTASTSASARGPGARQTRSRRWRNLSPTTRTPPDQDGSRARRLRRGHRARCHRAVSAKAAARICSSFATT